MLKNDWVNRFLPFAECDGCLHDDVKTSGGPMQFLIQQFLFPQHQQLAQRAIMRQCNYPNNYYGDQVCLPLQTDGDKHKS